MSFVIFRRWSENTISCGVNKIHGSSPGSCPESPIGLPSRYNKQAFMMRNFWYLCWIFRRHSSAHRRCSSSNLLTHSHPLPISPVSRALGCVSPDPESQFQLGGSMPNCLGRRHSNISSLGSQSSLCGNKGDWRNPTPPTSPSSLLQTFNNVVSAASAFGSTSHYKP